MGESLFPMRPFRAHMRQDGVVQCIGSTAMQHPVLRAAGYGRVEGTGERLRKNTVENSR